MHACLPHRVSRPRGTGSVGDSVGELRRLWLQAKASSGNASWGCNKRAKPLRARTKSGDSKSGDGRWMPQMATTPCDSTRMLQTPLSSLRPTSVCVSTATAGQRARRSAMGPSLRLLHLRCVCVVFCGLRDNEGLQRLTTAPCLSFPPTATVDPRLHHGLLTLCRGLHRAY